MRTVDPLEYVRSYYGVPAYKGVRVEYAGKQGVVTGGVNAYVKILLDGEKFAKPYHPTDGITYLVEGN